MKVKEEEDKEVESLNMESWRVQWINIYGFVAYIRWGGNYNTQYSETIYYRAVLLQIWYSEGLTVR